jgi:hypothetical protein
LGGNVDGIGLHFIRHIHILDNSTTVLGHFGNEVTDKRLGKSKRPNRDIEKAQTSHRAAASGNMDICQS